MTIKDLFSNEPPNVKTFSKAVPLAAADPALLFGVELEIEHTSGKDWLVPGMTGEVDGSLRNSGYEYITQPMTYSNLMYCLKTFFNKSQVTSAYYSERCSVHVHANCQDLTVEQLQGVLLLYQTFEGLLFNFAGEDRDRNIFCVPWSQTQLTHNIVNKLADTVMNATAWHKYTALNLLPLSTQGTIEFRHMPGTCDLDKLSIWFNLIGSLFAYTRTHTMEDIKTNVLLLNTNSHYRVFLFDVFKNLAEHLMVNNFEELLEDGVLNMKYSLIDVKKDKKKPESMKWVFDEFLANRAMMQDNPAPGVPF